MGRNVRLSALSISLFEPVNAELGEAHLRVVVEFEEYADRTIGELRHARIGSGAAIDHVTHGPGLAFVVADGDSELVAISSTRSFDVAALNRCARSPARLPAVSGLSSLRDTTFRRNQVTCLSDVHWKVVRYMNGFDSIHDLRFDFAGVEQEIDYDIRRPGMNQTSHDDFLADVLLEKLAQLVATTLPCASRLDSIRPP